MAKKKKRVRKKAVTLFDVGRYLKTYKYYFELDQKQRQYKAEVSLLTKITKLKCFYCKNTFKPHIINKSATIFCSNKCRYDYNIRVRSAHVLSIKTINKTDSIENLLTTIKINLSIINELNQKHIDDTE